MLILSRQKNQSIIVDDTYVIRIHSISGQTVKFEVKTLTKKKAKNKIK